MFSLSRRSVVEAKWHEGCLRSVHNFGHFSLVVGSSVCQHHAAGEAVFV